MSDRKLLIIMGSVICWMMIGCTAQSAIEAPTEVPTQAFAETATNMLPLTLTSTATATLTPTATLLPPMTGVGPLPPSALSRLSMGELLAIDVSPDGNYLAVASSGGLALYRLGTLQPVWFVQPESRLWVASVGFSPDGTRLAVSGGSLIDVWTGEQLLALEEGTGSTLVAWSPDGTLLASPKDESIVIWDANTGMIVRTMDGLDDPVEDLAWSDDGTLLAAGLRNETFGVWDARSGNPVIKPGRPAEPGWGTVYGVTFTADGNKLLVVFYDAVEEWDIVSGKRLRTLITTLPYDRHSFYGSTVAFSPNGALMAIGRRKHSDIDTVDIWDVQAGERLHVLQGFEGGASELVWLPESSDGEEILVVASYLGTIGVLNARTGQLLRRREGTQASSADAVVFSPDSAELATSVGDRVIVWDVETGEALEVLHGNEGYFFDRYVKGVSNLTWLPDGTILAIGYAEFNNWLTEAHVIWDARTGERLPTLTLEPETAHPGCCRKEWSPDGALFARALWDGRVILWDALTGVQLHKLEGHGGSFFGMARSLALSPDGTRLASGDAWRHKVIVWDTQTGQILLSLEGYHGSLGRYGLAWSPDGTMLASTPEDDPDNVIIWDAQTGQLLKTLEGHRDSVYCVSWSPDGSRLASGSFDEMVIIWDIQSGQMVQLLEGQFPSMLGVKKVIWSPDGSLVASVTDYTVIIWEVVP